MAVAFAALGASCTADGHSAEATLPISMIHRTEDSYDTPAELAGASSQIVLGTVVAQESLGTPDVHQDPHASEYFLISLKAEEVLKGELIDGRVAFVWEGYLTNGGKERTTELLLNGLAMPAVGDRLMLFIAELSPDESQVFKGSPTHRINTLDGILGVTAEGILYTNLSGIDTPAHTLNGLALEQAIGFLGIEVSVAVEG